MEKRQLGKIGNFILGVILKGLDKNDDGKVTLIAEYDSVSKKSKISVK